MTDSYALDKPNAKLMGVCAGFARWSGWNLLGIRLGLVVLTLFVFGPAAIIAYLVIGWVANE